MGPRHPTPTIRSASQLARAAWAVVNLYFPTLAGIAAIGVVADILFSASVPAGNAATGAMTAWSGLAILIGLGITLWMTTAMYYFLTAHPAEKNPFRIYRASAHLVGRVFSTGLLLGLLMLAMFIALFMPLVFFAGSGVIEAIKGANVPADALGGTGLFFLFGLLAILFLIVYFSIRWQFATLLVVTEKLANWSALKRSSALIRGRWWAVFGRLFLFGLAVGIVAALVDAMLSPVGEIFPVGTSIVQSVLTNIVIGPLVAGYTVQIFNDLRKSGEAPVVGG